MREIVFDFSEDDYLPKSGFGGFEGEHNATRLTLRMPERLLAPDAIYYMIFETETTGEVIFSAPLLPEGNAVQATLPKQVMRAPRVTVHAASYRKNGEDLVKIAKSARAVLEIKYPEGEGQKELSREGGKIPGLVIESSVLPESENPVSSAALYGELSALAGEGIESAFLDEDGNLILKKKNRNRMNVGNVIGPQGEQGPQGERGPKGDQGEKGEKGDPNDSPVANALKGTASGTKVVITDISPIEHELSVQLAVLPSSALLGGEGSLMFDICGEVEYGKGYPITDRGYDGAYDNTIIRFDIDGDENNVIAIPSYDYEILSEEELYEYETVRFEYDEETEERWIYLEKNGGGIDLSDVILKTVDGDGYEKEYESNRDGTVDGVTSLYPVTTLLTDPEGVFITAEYHRDLNKAFEEIHTAIQAILKKAE